MTAINKVTLQSKLQSNGSTPPANAGSNIFTTIAGGKLAKKESKPGNEKQAGNEKKTTTPPAISTTPPASKPTEAQDKKIADAGKEALTSYKKQAGTKEGRELLTKALTGKAADKLTAEERKTTDAYMKDVADGKFEGKDKTPQMTLKAAASGTEKDVKEGNAKLGDKILSPGVEGAYVDEKKTALVSNTALDAKGAEKTPGALAKTVNEEVGEYIAASASKAGVKIGAGDAGDRMALALKGEDTTGDKVLNTPQASDTAVVRIGNSVVSAKAAAASATLLPLTSVEFFPSNKNEPAKFTVRFHIPATKEETFKVFKNHKMIVANSSNTNDGVDIILNDIKASDNFVISVTDKFEYSTKFLFNNNDNLREAMLNKMTEKLLNNFSFNDYSQANFDLKDYLTQFSYASMVAQQVAIKADAGLQTFIAGDKRTPQQYADAYRQISNSILAGAGFNKDVATKMAYKLATYFTDPKFQKLFNQRSVADREVIKDNLFTTIATFDPAALQHISAMENVTDDLKDKTKSDQVLFRKLLMSSPADLSKKPTPEDKKLAGATLAVWLVGALREFLPVGSKLKSAEAVIRSASQRMTTELLPILEQGAQYSVEDLDKKFKGCLSASGATKDMLVSYAAVKDRFLDTMHKRVNGWGGLLPAISLASRLAQTANTDWNKVDNIVKARRILFPIADVLSLAEWAHSNQEAAEKVGQAIGLTTNAAIVTFKVFLAGMITPSEGIIAPELLATNIARVDRVFSGMSQVSGNLFNWMAPVTNQLKALASPVGKVGAGLGDITYGAVNFASGVNTLMKDPGDVRAKVLTTYGLVNMLAGINFAYPLVGTLSRGYFNPQGRQYAFYASRSGINIAVQLLAGGLATYFAVDSGKRLEKVSK